VSDFVPTSKLTLPLREIRRCVSERYKVTEAEMQGPSKAQRYARPRIIYMALCRELTDASWFQIAESCSRTNHSTAWMAERTVKKLCASNPRLATQLDEFRWALSIYAAQRQTACA
jgi:chromosomal replication initiator protein